MQVHPELRGGAEHLGKLDCGIRGKGGFASDDGIDAPSFLPWLNIANHRVFWCSSDRLEKPSTPVNTNAFTAYRHRYVIWWNTCVHPGLKDTDFRKPVRQVISHEDFDYHYNRLKDRYPTNQRST